MQEKKHIKTTSDGALSLLAAARSTCSPACLGSSLFIIMGHHVVLAATILAPESRQFITLTPRNERTFISTFFLSKSFLTRGSASIFSIVYKLNHKIAAILPLIGVVESTQGSKIVGVLASHHRHDDDSTST